MSSNKNLGIWMDHSAAHLINLKDEIQTINSTFDFEAKEEALSRSENLMHNKRQQKLDVFYKEIAAEIVKYKHVLLFGPTDAKVELHNFLKKDLHFKDIKICVEPTDKMTVNQKVAFVKEHFEV